MDSCFDSSALKKMVLGLKRFRACLSIKKEASKIPEMTGLYRRVSYSESTTQKNVEVSAAPPSVASDSTASDNNETVEYDCSKADLTSQSSSSIIDSEETPVKDNNKKSQLNNYAFEKTEPSTSKDLNIKEQSPRSKESNKIIKDQSESDTKSPICSDNELVI